MSDTIKYEKKQLEILYQELTGEKYETVCLLEAAYYGWLVYGVIHNEKLGVDCYKMINPVVEKGKTSLFVIDKDSKGVNEAMLEKWNPGYDGYCVSRGGDNKEKVPLIDTVENLSYYAVLNMATLNLVISGCEDEELEISFGDSKAFVFKKQSICDIIPEIKASVA